MLIFCDLCLKVVDGQKGLIIYDCHRTLGRIRISNCRCHGRPFDGSHQPSLDSHYESFRGRPSWNEQNYGRFGEDIRKEWVHWNLALCFSLSSFGVGVGWAVLFSPETYSIRSLVGYCFCSRWFVTFIHKKILVFTVACAVLFNTETSLVMMVVSFFNWQPSGIRAYLTTVVWTFGVSVRCGVRYLKMSSWGIWYWYSGEWSRRTDQWTCERWVSGVKNVTCDLGAEIWRFRFLA